MTDIDYWLPDWWDDPVHVPFALTGPPTPPGPIADIAQPAGLGVIDIGPPDVGGGGLGGGLGGGPPPGAAAAAIAVDRDTVERIKQLKRRKERNQRVIR